MARKAAPGKMQISPAGICSRENRRAGFTLLEIILVIFIISLFAAVVLPSFSGVGTGGLKAESKRVASLLRYLNDSAIYSKKTFDLTFDFQARQMTWSSPDGTKSQELAKITSVSLPSKGQVREGQVKVFFSPLGLRENIEITLADDVSNDTKDGIKNEMKVTMNALSGRVKITDQDSGSRTIDQGNSPSKNRQ